jgi:hypothetical protein
VLKRLNKLLGLVAWLGIIWACIVLCILYWPLRYVVIIWLIVKVSRKAPALWSHGTARWLSEKEAAPLMKAKTGILLGRMVK